MPASAREPSEPPSALRSSAARCCRVRAAPCRTPRRRRNPGRTGNRIGARGGRSGKWRSCQFLVEMTNWTIDRPHASKNAPVAMVGPAAQLEVGIASAARRTNTSRPMAPVTSRRSQHTSMAHRRRGDEHPADADDRVDRQRNPDSPARREDTRADVVGEVEARETRARPRSEPADECRREQHHTGGHPARRQDHPAHDRRETSRDHAGFTHRRRGHRRA